MTSFAAGLSYLNQISKDDFRKPHHTVVIGGQHDVNLNRYFGIGGAVLPGKIQPPENSFENLSTSGTAGSQWPHIPHATLQFGSYVYEDFVNGRTDEKVPVRFFEIFFHLEDNTVKIMESNKDRTEDVPPKFLSRQRIPRPEDPNLFLTVYYFAVGKSVLIYGRQHMVYSCDLYTRNTLTRMGFQVPPDQEPPFSQQMAAAKIAPMTEMMERHFNTDENFVRFLKYDRQVLRFDAIWDDTGSMFGDRHILLIHYYLSDETLEFFRKTPHKSGKDRWAPFIHRQKIPKNTADLNKVNPGAPWPVLKTMRSSRHPIKNYQLFDQAAYPENPPVFTEVDLLDCGKEICLFGRRILLLNCDDFTKWFYQYKYGKVMQPIPMPDLSKQPPRPAACPYNDHGSEEDSIRNCERLMPTPLVRDARRYLLVDQDPDDPVSLTFKARMLTESHDDRNRVFFLSYSLNNGSVCVKEKADTAAGGWLGTFLEKKPIKSGHNLKTTLPEYLQAEDLFVGATVALKGSVFALTETDESTLNYKCKKNFLQFPYSDIRKVMLKLAQTITQNSACGSYIRQRLEALDYARTEFITWDQFLDALIDIGRSSLNAQEYQTIGRNYFFYRPISKERRREILRTFLQQPLKQSLWEPRRSLLSALTKIDVHGRGILPRDDVLRTITATKIPAQMDLVQAYLELIETDNGIDYGVVVNDLDWIRNPGAAYNCPKRWMQISIITSTLMRRRSLFDTKTFWPI